MKLKLLTPAELKKVPKGTILYCIDGITQVEVGKDYIDDDTRGGFLAYGLKNDKDFNWDTKK